MLQFIAAVAAALFGVFISRQWLRMPFRPTPLAVQGVYWSVLALAYVIPRSVGRTARARLLGSALMLALVAAGVSLCVVRLRLPIPWVRVYAPPCAFFVFCAAAHGTGPRRSWSEVSAVLLPALAVHFILLWGSHGFQAGLILKYIVVPLIPFSAVTAALIAMDGVGKSPVLKAPHTISRPG